MFPHGDYPEPCEYYLDFTEDQAESDCEKNMEDFDSDELLQLPEDDFSWLDDVDM